MEVSSAIVTLWVSFPVNIHHISLLEFLRTRVFLCVGEFLVYSVGGGCFYKPRKRWILTI